MLSARFLRVLGLHLGKGAKRGGSRLCAWLPLGRAPPLLAGFAELPHGGRWVSVLCAESFSHLAPHGRMLLLCIVSQVKRMRLWAVSSCTRKRLASVTPKQLCLAG